MAGSTIEQLKAWWTPARKVARAREDRRIEEQYPEQYVAYIDDWNGEELVRTVVAVARDLGEFCRAQRELAPAIRKRLNVTRTHQPDELTLGGALFE